MTDRSALREALKRAREMGRREGYERARAEQRAREGRERGRRRERAASFRRHGLTVAEIARVMGLSENQVRGLLGEGVQNG